MRDPFVNKGAAQPGCSGGHVPLVQLERGKVMTQATSHIRSGAAELPVARDFAHWIEGRRVNGEGDAFARENPASAQIVGRY
jgi:hypothetical protein